MSSPITDEVLSSTLRQYRLENPRIIGRLEASKLNDNFLVEDAGGRRYVLRRYRRNSEERERIVFQLRFQQELHRRGFPTSQVVERSSGELLVTGEAGSWVLFTFIEGSEFDFSRMEQVAEAGRRLAQFHTVVSSIDLEVVIDVNYTLRRWWTHGDEELAALEEMFRGDGVEEELAFLRAWQAELLREWPLARLDALPAGWLHSDYHGRNMVFMDDELRGLFDFDPLRRGFLIEDVGHALFMFSRAFRGSTHMRPEAARLFLDEYHRRRPLRTEERGALPMAVVLAWAPSAPYHQLLRRDGEDTLGFFRHYVQLMRDLEAEMERLTPLLTEVS